MDDRLSTITQVSRAFGVTPRMLRYYEQAGLLQSRRVDGYAYRVYDDEATRRLGQILLLRKLRISVKDIAAVLVDPSAVAAIEVFRKNVAELEGEIDALAAVRSVLIRLIEALHASAHLPLHHVLAAEDSILLSIDALSAADTTLKNEAAVASLERAQGTLSLLKDVRILTLPPSAVASAHYIGDEPESRARAMMDAFVKERRLWEIKPDLRHYGFNHPNPKDSTGYHGYEIWVTISENMQVPAPLTKKHFNGGLYAAHMIAFGDFDQWEPMLHWVSQSDKYEFAGDFADQEHMCGLLDEHLNYAYHACRENTEPADTQFDLLMPIREKEMK